jgi:hypothetical protein
MQGFVLSPGGVKEFWGRIKKTNRGPKSTETNRFLKIESGRFHCIPPSSREFLNFDCHAMQLAIASYWCCAAALFPFDLEFFMQKRAELAR